MAGVGEPVEDDGPSAVSVPTCFLQCRGCCHCVVSNGIGGWGFVSSDTAFPPANIPTTGLYTLGYVPAGIPYSTTFGGGGFSPCGTYGHTSPVHQGTFDDGGDFICSEKPHNWCEYAILTVQCNDFSTPSDYLTGITLTYGRFDRYISAPCRGQFDNKIWTWYAAPRIRPPCNRTLEIKWDRLIYDHNTYDTLDGSGGTDPSIITENPGGSVILGCGVYGYGEGEEAEGMAFALPPALEALAL